MKRSDRRSSWLAGCPEILLRNYFAHKLIALGLPSSLLPACLEAVMATECIKNCCRGCLYANKEKHNASLEKQSTVTDKYTSKVVEKPPLSSVSMKKQVGCSEDYLLSKFPPGGKEIPFVVPQFKLAYIQPRNLSNPHLGGLQGSVVTSFSDRKAELSNIYHQRPPADVVYNPLYMQLPPLSPDFSQDHTEKMVNKRLYGSVCDLRSSTLPCSSSLSHSMFDLTSPPHRFLQCKDLNWSSTCEEHPQISIKGILTLHKPVQFRCLAKEASNDIEFMETFVFAIKLQLLQTARLVFKLYVKYLRFDSKELSVDTNFHSILQDTDTITLSGDERDFGRLNVKVCYNFSVEQIWITILKCKDLNWSSTCEEHPQISIKGILTLHKPVQFRCLAKEASNDIEFMETFVFAIKLQLLQTARLVFKVQSLIPRRKTIGECILPLRDLSSQEVDYWLMITPPSKALIVMLSTEGLVDKKKTRLLKSTNSQVKWGETLMFPVSQNEHGINFLIKLYSRSSVRRKHFLGQVWFSSDSNSAEAADQWRDTIANPEKVVVKWHNIIPA
ncbi:hypothetical protein E2320_021579 [Naja naja]|nr:hypothetical protein E2320_021579 [Naja naja]